jgi:hypothetical protein
MISMGTIEKLREQNHTLALYYISCDRWGEANLDWLMQIGKGNKPVTDTNCDRHSVPMLIMGTD